MSKKTKNKKAFIQFSFPWLFALIVGAFILFLTIYGVTKLIKTQETVQSAKTSKEIGILLNPLETGFEEAKTNILGFPVKTRIYSKCNPEGIFGRQLIQVSQLSFNKWTETDIDVGFSNKYIFSSNPSEGKSFLVFTKPFYFPFKVADLTYIISFDEIYCFINAPEDVEEEINNLNQNNLLTNCSEEFIQEKNAKKVCFGSSKGCEIKVDYERGIVEKKQGKVYFSDNSLMYAGIFSNPEVYECQIKRLMKRAASLADLYLNKIETIGCGDSVKPELSLLTDLSNNLESSRDLNSLDLIADEINEKNQKSTCRLW